MCCYVCIALVSIYSTYSIVCAASLMSCYQHMFLCVSMCLRSSHIVDWASIGYGCQSCSWSAGQGIRNFPLSLFAPENPVSRDGFSRPVPRQPVHWLIVLYQCVCMACTRMYIGMCGVSDAVPPVKKKRG